MNNLNLFVEPQEHLMEAVKVYGFNLVFEEGVIPGDFLVQSVIEWAKSQSTLGLVEDPCEVEYEDDDFGDGLAVSIQWAHETDAISYEVINLLAAYLSTYHPNCGCKEIQIYTKMGDGVVMH